MVWGEGDTVVWGEADTVVWANSPETGRISATITSQGNHGQTQ